MALPLTAVFLFHVSPLQLGILQAAIVLPNLAFGLLAGVWVDRARRGPIMVGADLGRAVLLCSIPLAALFHALTFTQLCVVGFGAGTLTVFFEVASTSILPSILPGEQLLEANSKLALGDSVISLVGPSMAGGLIQFLSAPRAIIVDAGSYLISALSLGSLGSHESRPAPKDRPAILVAVGEGLRALMQTPILRAVTTSSMVASFFLGIQNAALILFLTRDMGLTPTSIGLVYTASGAGSVMGAAVAGRAARIIGTGRAIVAGTVLTGVAGIIVPLAAAFAFPVPTLLAARVLVGIGTTLYSVNQLTLRQRHTAVAVLGRVNAARRFLVFSVMPLGALLGGFLGGALGVRDALLVGACGFLGAAVVLLASPARLPEAAAPVTV